MLNLINRIKNSKRAKVAKVKNKIYIFFYRDRVIIEDEGDQFLFIMLYLLEFDDGVEDEVEEIESQYEYNKSRGENLLCQM